MLFCSCNCGGELFIFFRNKKLPENKCKLIIQKCSKIADIKMFGFCLFILVEKTLLICVVFYCTVQVSKIETERKNRRLEGKSSWSMLLLPVVKTDGKS